MSSDTSSVQTVPGLQETLQKIYALEKQLTSEMYEHLGVMQVIAHEIHNGRVVRVESLRQAIDSEYELTGDTVIFGEIAEKLGFTAEEVS